MSLAAAPKSFYSTGAAGGEWVREMESQVRRPGPLAAAKGISFRVETEEDVPFLAALFASMRADEVATTGWSSELQHAFLAQQFDAQRRHYRQHYQGAEWLVVEHEGRAVGRLYLMEYERELRIVDISILPGNRGLGLGSAMLGDVIEEAESCGKAVTIHVERNNPAMGLYLRLGFAQMDEVGIYFLMRRDPPAAG